MTKRMKLTLIAAICAIGAACFGFGMGALLQNQKKEDAPPPPIGALREEHNPALMQLAAASDIQAELLARQTDPVFVDTLIAKGFSFRDLANLAEKRAGIHAALSDTEIEGQIRLRLAQLAIIGRHHLLASMADWSRAYRTIYQVNRSYNVASLPGILDEYSIVVQKYAPLSFDAAFADWNLSDEEGKVARPLYEAAVEQHGKPKPHGKPSE